MERITEIKEVFTFPYKYRYGKWYGTFYEGLRQGRIMATRCGKCGRTFLPPRPYCGWCFADIQGWVEVKDEGIVKSFTIVYMPFIGQPTKPPYCYALIVLDGCDTELHHRLDEIDFKDVHVGMRVKAVWREERKGTIHDIKYFRPVK